MQASYLASRASSWSGDCLTLPENLQKPMREGSVARFTDMLRETADMIDRMHEETTDDDLPTAEDVRGIMAT